RKVARMSEGKQDEGKRAGFKVSDRRSFADQSGAEVKSAGPENPPAPAPTDQGTVNLPADAASASPASSPTGGDRDSADADSSSEADALLPVDFHTFILSLGSSALLHLGELDHPDGREARPDLRLAKHTIDIIGMLEEKTRGNLSPPEARLMESLLYDLRLRYIERGQKSPKRT
ncbi:MAG: DUF1844 domain-containing protein, partial [Myxococcales bacterium]